jgi:hypothetical protein
VTAPYGYRSGEVKILCDGQSFNYAPDDANSFPQKLRPMLPGKYRVEIVGRSATTYAQRALTASARVDHRIPIYDRCILVDLAGQSDIIAAASGGGDLTGAQTYAAMQSYWKARRVAGIDRIVACTVPKMSSAWLDADGETQRQALNTLILASTDVDAVADLAGLANAQDPTNTTYFYDGLHPTAALATEFATLIKTAIETAMAVQNPLFTGGTETDFAGYRIHTFTAGGTLTMVRAGHVECLVVGGGGGGGTDTGVGASGGGGAGDHVLTSAKITATQTVTVGGGGAANASGSPSSIGSLVTAVGGGRGRVNSAGGDGASGGGAGMTSSTGFAGGSATGIDGNAGGACAATATAGLRQGGGGGGAGSAGVAGTTAPKGGNGGSGELSSITGAEVRRAAGGGGGSRGAAGTKGVGGAGGGGDGGDGASAPGTAGAVNTGSGGGGGRASGAGGAGGSGIVVIRYRLN